MKILGHGDAPKRADNGRIDLIQSGVNFRKGASRMTTHATDEAVEPEPPNPPDMQPRWVRCIDRMTVGLAIAAGTAGALLMVHVLVDVAGRTFFNSPAPGTFNIVTYWWMVTLVFAAFGYAQLRGEHIRATILTDHLPARWNLGAEVAAMALLGLLGVLLAYYGWNAAVESAEIGETVLDTTPIPIWPFRFLVPLAGVSLALQCVTAIHAALSGTPHKSHDEGLV